MDAHFSLIVWKVPEENGNRAINTSEYTLAFAGSLCDSSYALYWIPIVLITIGLGYKGFALLTIIKN